MSCLAGCGAEPHMVGKELGGPLSCCVSIFDGTMVLPADGEV